MAPIATTRSALSTKLLSLAAAASLAACQGLILEPSHRAGDGGLQPDAPNVWTPSRPTPPPRVVPRLTAAQYRNAMGDLLGPGEPRVELEADTNPLLFTTIGAATATLSGRGADAFHRYAMELSATAFADPARRAALVRCAGDGAPSEACTREFITRLGRRAFRRPLEGDEVARYAAVASSTGVGDAWRGLRYATAALLSSPSFLYRAESGEPTPGRPGWNRYTGYEIASRLAFVLWSSVPDDTLLDAAAAGTLSGLDGTRAQARRMVDDPRARVTVRNFFNELLNLGRLDTLARDPSAFPQASQALGRAMREDVLRRVDDVVFERPGDYRTLFGARDAFVNRELAGFYGVPFPGEGDAFVRVTLPTTAQRRGLMASAGVLALTSHASATSPTGRGRYVRERLLCERVPDPPPEVNPSLMPDPPGTSRTMRERLERHRTDPLCASCHRLTDPVGLGLENFDAIGALRMTEAGRPVDDSGDLDGASFRGAAGLGDLLATDPRVARCLVVQFWRYANARRETSLEEAAIDELTARFAQGGYRVRDLLIDAVASDAFRIVAAP